jgi:hypothetical protein
MHRHPTIRAWTREEDGSYKAELSGFALHVSWTPGDAAGQRGFGWKAERDEVTLSSQGLEEEIEIAMGLAEEAVFAAANPAPTLED